VLISNHVSCLHLKQICWFSIKEYFYYNTWKGCWFIYCRKLMHQVQDTKVCSQITKKQTGILYGFQYNIYLFTTQNIHSIFQPTSIFIDIYKKFEKFMRVYNSTNKFQQINMKQFTGWWCKLCPGFSQTGLKVFMEIQSSQLISRYLTTNHQKICRI